MRRRSVPLLIPSAAALVEGLVAGLPLHVGAAAAAAALALSLRGRQEACFPAIYSGLVAYGLLAGTGDPGGLGLGFLAAAALHIAVLDSYWRRLYRGFVSYTARIRDIAPDAAALAAAIIAATLSYAAASQASAALLASPLPGLRYLGSHYSGHAGQAALTMITAALALSLFAKLLRLYHPYPPLPALAASRSWSSRLADRIASAARPRGAARLTGYMLLALVLMVSATRPPWLASTLLAGYAARRLAGRRLGPHIAFALGAALALLVVAGPYAGRGVLVEAEASAKSFEALLRAIVGG